MNSCVKALLVVSLSVLPLGCGKSEPPRVLKATPEEQKKLDVQHADIVKGGGKTPSNNAAGSPSSRAAHGK